MTIEAIIAQEVEQLQKTEEKHNQLFAMLHTLQDTQAQLADKVTAAITEAFGSLNLDARLALLDNLTTSSLEEKIAKQLDNLQIPQQFAALNQSLQQLTDAVSNVKITVTQDTAPVEPEQLTVAPEPVLTPTERAEPEQNLNNSNRVPDNNLPSIDSDTETRVEETHSAPEQLFQGSVIVSIAELSDSENWDRGIRMTSDPAVAIRNTNENRTHFVIDRQVKFNDGTVLRIDEVLVDGDYILLVFKYADRISPNLNGYPKKLSLVAKTHNPDAAADRTAEAK